jgi:hypothetical protein
MWDRWEEGDKIRDEALKCAQLRDNLDQIPTWLGRVQDLHEGDADRQIILQTVRGRVSYADRLYGEAIHAFQTAEFELMASGPNDYLQCQNDFYWLKASVMHGGDQDETIRLIANLRQSSYTTSSQRRTIGLIEAFGRPACRFIDWVTYTDGNRLITWLSRIGPFP